MAPVAFPGLRAGRAQEVRIDLITTATGVDFAGCWGRRLGVPVGAVEAGFISYENLIANKQASGRPQDLVDVEVLESKSSDE